MKDETKAKLDKAAVKFAKSFGDCIKNKQVGRIEDETKDALMAIKKTIRVNSNVKSNPMSSMFIHVVAVSRFLSILRLKCLSLYI